MTSHELARQLLELPDLPVKLSVGDPKDTFVGDVGDCKVKVGEIDVETATLRGYPDMKPGQCVMLTAWQSSEEGDGDDED